MHVINNVTSLTDEDRYYIKKFHFGMNVINDSPIWLQKWCALICRFISYEYDNAIEEQLKYNKSLTQNEAIEIRKSILETRLNSVIATIDRVKRYLSLSGTQEPPLVKLKFSSINKKFWTDSDSLK